MKRHPLILVSLLCLSALSYDQDVPDFATRFEATKTACFQQDYSTHAIQSPKQPGWDYSMSKAEEAIGPGLGVISQGSIWVHKVARKNVKTPAEIHLDEMMKSLRDFANEQKLDSWGRACLTKCVTAHMVEYTEDGGLLLQPSRIAEEGVGVCKQFALLGEYVGKELGVKTNVTTHYTTENGFDGHSYLQIEIDGVGYYSEPQHADCTFYSHD